MKHPKIVSGLLTAAVLLSTVMPVSGAFAFSDTKKIAVRCRDAVTAMSEKGIITGYEDNTFRPSETLTRAQAAKILCVMQEGTAGAEALTSDKASFTDVPVNHWSNKFVEYCAAKGIVSGVGKGKFNPNGKLTGMAFAKMLLAAKGYDTTSLTGEKWAENTEKLLESSGRGIGASVTTGDITREKACLLAYNFTLDMPDTSNFVKDTELPLTESFYKLLSGSYLCDTGLTCAWGTSGLEFTVDCMGDISMKYTAELNGYFQCFVDGKEAERVRTLSTDKTKTVKIAKDLLPGTHTVRIVQEHDIPKTGEATVIQSIKVNGIKSSAKATAEKQPYYVFLGDSVVVGKGSLGTGVYEGDDEMHSATHGFAYLAAEELNADYTVIARGGIGLVKRTTIPLLLPEILGYRNIFKDETPVTYERKPDAVVAHIGINDAGLLNDKSEMVPLLKELVTKIRSLWGADVPVVFMYNNMSGYYNDQYVQAAKELTGVYAVEGERNNNGGSSQPNSGGHPNAASQARNAKTLAEFLKTLK